MNIIECLAGVRSLDLHLDRLPIQMRSFIKTDDLHFDHLHTSVSQEGDRLSMSFSGQAQAPHADPYEADGYDGQDDLGVAIARHCPHSTVVAE